MTQKLRIAVLLCVATVLGACAGSGAGLNSDSIQQRFGSYGVEVLQAGDMQRISSLYSGSGDTRTTRTYAVVDFMGRTAGISAEHAAILDGASIGLTFRKAGWQIHKQNLFIGELEIPATYHRLAEMMHIELPATLATHEYLFVVSKDGRSLTYAKIIEIHHPDYLTAADLTARYGEILFDDSNRDSIHDFLGPPPGK